MIRLPPLSHETKFDKVIPFVFHSQQISIELIQTQIDIMDQIKLGIFDLERQDRERKRFAHERGNTINYEIIYFTITYVVWYFSFKSKE